MREVKEGMPVSVEEREGRTKKCLGKMLGGALAGLAQKGREALCLIQGWRGNKTAGEGR